MPNKKSPILFFAGIFFLLNISCLPTRLIDKSFTIRGKAHTSKLGATIWYEEESKLYFLEGLKTWPKHLENKQVEVSGSLYKEETNLKRVAEDGSTYVVQGVKDFKLIIKKSKWSLIE